MAYEQHRDLKPEDFKRFCGVDQGTFDCMVSVLHEQVEQKKQKPGKPSKLSLAKQVLLCLEYWREDRTYFHIGLANSLNPVGIVLPCHRVVGANFSLTGYAGGLEWKQWLQR